MKLWGLGQISPDEKQNILSQHKEIYNGYRTVYPNTSNTQPLYVQDFAKDKVGAVLNNKGIAKPYTNVGINEQIESKEVCDECGSMMMEGECTECGWKGEVGAMEEEKGDDVPKEFRPGVDLGKAFARFKELIKKDDEEEKEEDDDFTLEFRGGSSPGYGAKPFRKVKNIKEETGHLDDIYNVNDLGDNDFDYVEGGGNKFGTFEKMHHMKKIKSESEYEDTDNEDDGFEDIETSELDEIGTQELLRGKRYKLSTPSFEDDVEFEDEIEDISGGNKMFKFKGKKEFSHLLPDKYIENFLSKSDEELDEQGYTGGGNAPDNSKSLIKPAYDFVSDGPVDAYPTEEKEYETMESAFADEIDEIDVSGVQGIYGDMKPAYDFDSEGPGKAGPYQRSSWGGGAKDDTAEDDVYWQKDVADDELDLDIEKFNPEDKSWEEITAHTGEDEFEHLDEDIKESFIQQKNKITEMFTRMKVIK